MLGVLGVSVGWRWFLKKLMCLLSVELVSVCHRRRGQNRGQPFRQRRNSKCHNSGSQNVYFDVKADWSDDLL